MTILFYLKPHPPLDTGKTEYDLVERDGARRRKKKAIKELKLERLQRIAKDDEEILLMLLTGDLDI